MVAHPLRGSLFVISDQTARFKKILVFEQGSTQETSLLNQGQQGCRSDVKWPWPWAIGDSPVICQ